MPTNGLPGTPGNDVLYSIGDGAHTLDGGAGNDRLVSDGGGDTLLGGDGIDIADLRLQGYSDDLIIDLIQEQALTEGDPTILYTVGGTPSSPIVALNSIEQLFFYGGSGNDQVTGGNLSDRLDGGLGKDILKGMGGNDQLFGHMGNSSLDGGTGADVITIDGFVANINGGTDTKANGQVDVGVIDKLYINGTAGFDTAGHVGNITNVEQVFVKAGLSPISFSHDNVPQIAQLNGGKNPAIAGMQIYVTDVSDGAGGYLGSTITGSEFGDTVSGGLGNDHLIGNKGSDTLLGGAGDDTLEGGIGTDSLDGGTGNDTFLVFSGPAQQPDAIVNGGSGTDKLFLNENFVNQASPLVADFSTGGTSVNGTTFSSIEILNYDGAQSADVVTGTDLADQINGRQGDDTIKGGKGDDILFGGTGTDTAVYAGLHSEYTITPAANAASFATVADSVAGRSGTDSIKEFEFLKFDDGTLNLATNAFTP